MPLAAVLPVGAIALFMTPHEFAEQLCRLAESQIEAGSLGIVGGVGSPDRSAPVTFAIAPHDAPVGDAALDLAWTRVRQLLREQNASMGGVIADAALLDDDPDPQDGSAFQFQVESTDGQYMAAFVPYRRRRLRGLQVGGAVFFEPETFYLDEGP